MTCLDDRRLLEVHHGDADPAERAHLAGCTTCAGRLRALRTDLLRIETVLRETVPPRRRLRREAAWRWVPVAVAAALALAVGLQRYAGTYVAPAPDDTLSLAMELSDAMASYDYLDDDTAATTTARSTCTWGDPLLGVGCDEPAVMRIAWR